MLLNTSGLSATQIYGNMDNSARQHNLNSFQSGRCPILVVTDVAARGIDVHNLGFVIHHQLPEHIEYYTHRSGRTARGGRKGDSIALILPNEMETIVNMQKTLNITFLDRTL